ncbi:MAG: prenyltransferase [Thermodesulfobacteriota bacterium]
METHWKDWVALSRPHFHSVGVLPFVLGLTLSWRIGNPINWPVFLLGVFGVILIMLAADYGGETYDIREDSTTWSEGGNPFSGGSGMVIRGRISPQQAKRASLTAFLAAILLGIFLQFGLKTGPWTLPLGLTGAFAGYYYSIPPFRWVKRGFGELLIAFCYGWLPVAMAFYLQTGSFHPLVLWLSFPIGCTIFNVILLNEFPDYQGDSQSGKKNLVVRLGRDYASKIYGVVTLLAWIFLVLSLFAGAPVHLAILATPLYLMGGKIYRELQKGAYHDKHILRKLCGLNLLINLGTTTLMILCVILWM